MSFLSNITIVYSNKGRGMDTLARHYLTGSCICRAKATLTQIIVFTKRRGGEASRLKVDTHLEVKKKSEESEFNEELFSSLTEEEKVLAKCHLLVRTIGKCGTHVPIILTRKMKTAIDALLADREILGFSDSNPFIFGIPGCDTHLKAWTILNAFCQKFQIPGITSTSLRKYLATTAQALDLGGQQIGWISHHMGHSIDVHNKYYRKNDAVIEVGKITKLLHALQEGTLHQNRGKTIETMEVHDWDLQDYPAKDIASDGSNVNALSALSSCSEDEEPQGRTGTKSKKKKALLQKAVIKQLHARGKKSFNFLRS
jgi:hypothetical protein